MTGREQISAETRSGDRLFKFHDAAAYYPINSSTPELQRMVNVDEEINLLQQEIRRLGAPDPKTGNITVKFGKLVRDERCGDICTVKSRLPASHVVPIADAI